MVRAKAPKEDPTAKATREREQARADAAYIENAQGLVDDETRRRLRRLGRRTSLRGVSPGGGLGGAGGIGGGGGSFMPIGSAGGGGFPGRTGGGGNSEIMPASQF